MKPIKYFNCADCNYPIYGDFEHIVKVISNFKGKCPNCDREILNHELTLKDDEPSDSTWREEKEEMPE